MGILLNDFFAALFTSLTSVAVALIITGIILYISDRFDGNKTINDMKSWHALVIGFFQGCAITPGLSP